MNVSINSLHEHSLYVDVLTKTKSAFGLLDPSLVCDERSYKR
jgi:hypothetical protein